MPQQYFSAKDVIAICEKDWDANKDDCGHFVISVARDLGVSLVGNANNIVDALQKNWIALDDGVSAASAASLGYFVVAGLRATPHGHVVVIVQGPLNRHKYPTAYWGMFQAIGKKFTTTNWSWAKEDLGSVLYFKYPHLIPKSA